LPPVTLTEQFWDLLTLCPGSSSDRLGAPLPMPSINPVAGEQFQGNDEIHKQGQQPSTAQTQTVQETPLCLLIR